MINSLRNILQVRVKEQHVEVMQKWGVVGSLPLRSVQSEQQNMRDLGGSLENAEH